MDTSAEIIPRVRGAFDALVLFGSRARGEDSPSSDIDVLQVTGDKIPSYREGPLSVSVYSSSALADLARSGSLFVLHLKTEGRVLSDDSGTFAATVARYAAPKSYAPFRRELQSLARLLLLTEPDYSDR